MAELSLGSGNDARARKSSQSPAAGWCQEDSPFCSVSWRHFQDAVSVGASICCVSLQRWALDSSRAGRQLSSSCHVCSEGCPGIL